MLYRIRIDLMFPNQIDGDEVWAALKNYLKNKEIKSLVNETSYIDYHKCLHEENLPCEPIQRFEKE